MEWSKKEHKVEFITLSAEEKAKWSAKAAPLVDEYIKKMEAAKLPGKEIVEDAKKLTEKYNDEFK
jgi:carboxylesterase type B